MFRSVREPTDNWRNHRVYARDGASVQPAYARLVTAQGSAQVPEESAARPVHPSVRVDRRPVDEAESRRANGPDWDRYADEYQATHGRFLATRVRAGSEGLTEDEAGVLGDVADRDVLEVGVRGRQCSRWARSGGLPVGPDCGPRSTGPRRIDERLGIAVPSVLGTGHVLLFAERSFDTVSASSARCSCSDIADAVADAARVLLPGGGSFSITHPTRWMFPTT